MFAEREREENLHEHYPLWKLWPHHFLLNVIAAPMSLKELE